jgi:energy-coupling factor transport system ATP-binding protein
VIRFDHVSVQYPEAAADVLRDVTLHIPEGELCLVVGRTGTGKSTLLGVINGLVPHFTGGTLSGRVLVAGRDTRTHKPRDLADVVGVVRQNPRAGFVADVVEDELAYGMEWLGLPPSVMRRRVEETLDLLGLADVRARPIANLSAGQQQRVAIGAALTAHPKILVLDEPTSALDPPAAEEVLAALQRLVHDLGMTVVLAEHRLERVVQYADHVVHLFGTGHPVVAGDPADVMATAAVAPPVVELGRVLKLRPVPLSVRDARRRTAAVRERLTRQHPTTTPVTDNPGPVLASVRRLVLTYAGVPALREVDFQLRAGEIVALMGRNGAGKSSLLATMVGLRRPSNGSVRIGDLDPVTAEPTRVAKQVGLVPQQPEDLLYAARVADECAEADRDALAPAGTTARLLNRLAPDVTPHAHPRDLSEGQRLCLALAVVLAARPPVLLLDEPTRGLDYAAKRRLVSVLRNLARDGHGVVLATHDVELVAEVATRVVVLADGEIVADGPTDEVVVGSPAFAPQVAKVFAPAALLTVADVTGALGVAS